MFMFRFAPAKLQSNLSQKKSHSMFPEQLQLPETNSLEGDLQYTYQNTPGNAWTAKQQSVAIYADDRSRILNSKSVISLKAIK